MQWIITGYALTYGSLLLTGGRIGDLAGHRRMLLAGLVLFGLTSLAAGLATSFVVLVVARFAQGASAALVAPSALAVLTGIYREGPARTRALHVAELDRSAIQQCIADKRQAIGHRGVNGELLHRGGGADPDRGGIGGNPLQREPGDASRSGLSGRALTG